jgi:hypothetical protein
LRKIILKRPVPGGVLGATVAVFPGVACGTQDLGVEAAVVAGMAAVVEFKRVLAAAVFAPVRAAAAVLSHLRAAADDRAQRGCGLERCGGPAERFSELWKAPIGDGQPIPIDRFFGSDVGWRVIEGHDVIAGFAWCGLAPKPIIIPFAHDGPVDRDRVCYPPLRIAPFDVIAIVVELLFARGWFIEKVAAGGHRRRKIKPPLPSDSNSQLPECQHMVCGRAARERHTD